ncbi:sulfite oxidase heme-binding subunit YedZ [Marinagarivorans algicola]|uniref:sulfite oxidase heme-binding subunit YedZ n=1 Tax=Marinagarivorans algicola TaxID=1513270 RepID=UPI0006B57470|nr:protein-methionine-sulfoxide reductase heme-binding subunit MsrQ [Marinagarivorans algicola]
MALKTLTRWLGHVLGVLPALYLVALSAFGGLGANPIETLTHQTGRWALTALLLSLAVTPAVRWLRFDRKWHVKYLMPWRKILGLYAFFYAVLHFLIYLIFDLSFDFHFLWADVKDRPYIAVGFIALCLLLPLVATSNKKAQRALGKRWIALHRLVYLIDALVLVHFFWLIRADYSSFWWYAGAYLFLMMFRLKVVTTLFSRPL